MPQLPQISPARKNGNEPIHDSNRHMGKMLSDFWSWAFSDLIDNTERGALAEYLVALAIGKSDGVRSNWEPFDLITRDGIRVEVKSAAYVQSWGQKDYSKPIFRIGETHAYDKENNEYQTDKRRQSDVYVFALLSHKDQQTIDPLDLSQWEFHIISRQDIDKAFARQSSVALSRLEPFGAKTSFQEIHDKILECMAKSGGA